MKWKQLFKDLNLFLFYQPDIDIKTARQIISIFQVNTSLINQMKHDIDFKQLQQINQKQLSIEAYSIYNLRKNLKKINGGKID